MVSAVFSGACASPDVAFSKLVTRTYRHIMLEKVRQSFENSKAHQQLIRTNGI